MSKNQKIKDFNDYIIEKSNDNTNQDDMNQDDINLDEEKLKKIASNIGLDLTKNLSKKIELI